ncbi:MAG: photosystem I reaction center subunit XII [Leptolyngbya sp. SIOISBB]|nr:photosystem I reaction center subunit XII [Leptolyngbya sp. SIOISBB]
MALWLSDTDVLELRPNFTEDDLQLVVRAVYKQVLGNAHLMESQRLVTAESLLRDGDITVKGFVRAVAQSDLYRSLFFENSSPYRLVELNFKHLLGRAPQDQAEISKHVVLYNEQGYVADINSYLDNDEYNAKFGENIVPYNRANTQVGLKNVTFNRNFALMRGFATDDSGKQAKLTSDLGANLPTKIKAPVGKTGTYDNTGKRFKVTVSNSGATAQLGHRTTQEYVVSYSQLSQKMRAVFKSGGKVLSVAELS